MGPGAGISPGDFGRNLTEGPVLHRASDVFGHTVNLFGRDLKTGLDAEIPAGFGAWGSASGPDHEMADGVANGLLPDF